jgi:hypothetical protein
MNHKDKDLNWENRILCSDESCIGVIDLDGRCKECGLAFQGELPATFTLGSFETSVASQTEAVAEAPALSGDSAVDDELPVDADDEWARRKLCSDESCIGVIGSDGRCKECGKPYQG